VRPDRTIAWRHAVAAADAGQVLRGAVERVLGKSGGHDA